MLAIEMRFLAGRYHATPWGRHVNEGVTEWPPSPYRLIRALYDSWKRKAPDVAAERVEAVFRKLAGDAPEFDLPAATASHTRSYLHQNTEDPSKKSLIFDGFVAVDPSQTLTIVWRDVVLDAEGRGDLAALLAGVNYLGRSESWVSLRLLDEPDRVEVNCAPASERKDGDWEPVTVACVKADSGAGWMAELTYSTTQLIKERRSEPPALRWVEYWRPANCFAAGTPRRQVRGENVVESVLFALDSKVLPLAVDGVIFSERVRRKLMGIHQRLVGSAEGVSWKFSGKDSEGRPKEGHRHAFFLPMDLNGDGRLDHMMVATPEGFDGLEQVALDELRSMWQEDGRPDVQFVPVRRGAWAEGMKAGRVLRSVTPFVPTRHYRKGRGDVREWIEGELRLELSRRGLPLPVGIEWREGAALSGNRWLRWFEFRRNRKGDTPQSGYGFRLEFAVPMAQPLVLGYGCHYGLGLFLSDESRR